MIRTIVIAATLAVGATTAFAQDDPIAARQKIYKSWGAAAKEPGQMLKGEAPFDLAKVQAALRAFEDGSKHLPDLFPETSKTGGNTEALPAIWEQREKFNALFVKFGTDSRTALDAIKNEATFKAEFPKVLQNCGSCHNTFRAKR